MGNEKPLEVNPAEQALYEEVYEIFRHLNRGDRVKWRNTTIEFVEDLPHRTHKMVGKNGKEYFHWDWHMSAVMVVSLCEGIPLGVVKEPE